MVGRHRSPCHGSIVLHRGWHFASGLLGLCAVAVGIAAIISPALAASIYGIDDAGDPVWVIAAGIRDLGLGFALLGAVGKQSTSGIIALLAGLALVGAGDAILLWSIKGPVFAHLFHVGGCAVSASLALVGIRIRATTYPGSSA